MNNKKINKIEEINPETNTCSGTCDDNCKIKNKAFLNYQYRPTGEQLSSYEKSGLSSSRSSVCL